MNKGSETSDKLPVQQMVTVMAVSFLIYKAGISSPNVMVFRVSSVFLVWSFLRSSLSRDKSSHSTIRKYVGRLLHATLSSENVLDAIEFGEMQWARGTIWNVISTAPSLFLFYLVQISVHLGVILRLRKLFSFDLKLLLIASKFNVWVPQRPVGWQPQKDGELHDQSCSARFRPCLILYCYPLEPHKLSQYHPRYRFFRISVFTYFSFIKGCAACVMASVSSQPQFRYTQTPSKVLHLRNLPWECAEEELIELGKPFGKVVNTKCNVGANKNQAFIEFADLNQAIAMISYYASSSEPAQIRGKTVYLQYSNRQEIVNNKTTADTAGNVLLVTVEGNDARQVSIDVLHLALIQFSDTETASSAKNALDGRGIPSYLLPDHLEPCTLKITYSAHTDLSVKFQSHRSRDYTNPYLPVAPSAIDATGQLGVGLDGRKLEPESNVLLASIENMQYAVTLDVLQTVFSAFGFVQKIAMFDKNGGLQALIQYPDVQTAIAAKEALEGHCIYDGGFCKLHLSYSRHTDLSIKMNNDRSRDYTQPNPAIPPPIIAQQPPVPTSGAAPGQHYNGAHYAGPPASSGWGPQQPMGMQMPMQNYPYMQQGSAPPGPPGTMPPGSMQNPNGGPQQHAMPPYSR
ncbi:hypothetical protein KSS87_000063 [Heliosperma pusillum]|nr:hypothetical protein KSS87_000063 [Heliosperma pusillum]